MRRSELLRKWSAFLKKFLVSEAKYAPKIVHKNLCAILLIMPILNVDILGRSFRNKTPAFLFVREPSARFGSDYMEADYLVTAEFGLLRRLTRPSLSRRRNSKCFSRLCGRHVVCLPLPKRRNTNEHKNLISVSRCR